MGLFDTTSVLRPFSFLAAYSLRERCAWLDCRSIWQMRV